MYFIYLFIIAFRYFFWKHSPKGDWLECFRNRLQIERHIVKLLHNLASQFYSKADVDKREYQELVSLVEKEDGALLGYVKDTLLQLLEGEPK